jgi:hypothetical protein
MTEKALFEDFSRLSLNSVLQLLHDHDLMNYSQQFRESRISGYDLCFITDEILKNELKVVSFHDRNEILKLRDKLLLEQCKKLLS